MLDFLEKYKLLFDSRYLMHDFSRMYEFGDNMSHIDSMLSAKKGELFIKKYSECRDVDLLLVLDISRSQLCGSYNSKLSIMYNCADKICSIANKANDRVGMMVFSNKIEKYLPANRKLKYINIDGLINRQSNYTNPLTALTCLQKVLKNSTVIFWMSDFLYPNKIIKDVMNCFYLLSKKHRLICIQITDSIDVGLLKIGKVSVQDAESGEVMVFNTTKKNLVQQMYESWSNRLKFNFKQSGIKFIQLSTCDDIYNVLSKCFDKHLA